MDKGSPKKRNLILSKAKQVFIRKGFASVTMKDIIEECNISRGGIYLYFQSVNEIFMHVIDMHNKQKLKETKKYITEDKSFDQLIDEYLDKQKNRLMNLNNSLLIAMYEYRFAHQDDYHKEFYYNQFMYTKNIVIEILRYGVKKGDISTSKIDDLAVSIVFQIEGISMLVTSTEVSKEFIDKQIEFIKQMIFHKIDS